MVGIGLLPAMCMGCRPVFSVYPDELSEFRIMAMGIEERDDLSCPVASAVIWSGDGVIHFEDIILDWSLDGEVLGEGWEQPVCDVGRLSLVATSSTGVVREGFVSVGDPATPIFPTREAVTVDDTSIESRRDLDGLAVSAGVQLGEVSRTFINAFQEADRVRWMSPAESGEVLELEVDAADIIGETITYDEGEVVERESLGPTITSHFALSVDGAGGNKWGWIDSSFGVEDASLLRHEGRIIDVSGEDGFDVSTEMLAFTITVSEGELEFTEFEPVSDLTESTVTCGLDSQPFRMEWMNSGRCTADELDGRRVVVELW